MPRKIVARRSPIHGNGVFAAEDLPAGTELIEYQGRLITRKQADNWYGDEMYTGHTFLFTLNDKYIIDANVDGNNARWINHSCEPNSVPYLRENVDPKKEKVFIETMRAVMKGEEITYDYGIAFDEPYTAKLKKIWACRCGSPSCTGTMLKPVDAERVIIGK